MTRPSPAEIDALVATAGDWLARTGRAALEFQQVAWRACLEGRSGLINAPTGSGKTFAAWIGPLLAARHAQQGAATPAARRGPRLLWITPLRALANDLARNLQEPLAPLGVHWRIGQRTGDTPASLRQRQRAEPPEALIITPESVSVLLSHAGSHDDLAALDFVIVDEWHELLGNKRGVLLELALARLRRLNPGLRVWGISATLPNLEEAAAALLGPRVEPLLIRSNRDKRTDIVGLIPRDVERFPWAGHIGTQQLEPVIAAIEQARTTLVFTNTRSQAEIWYEALVERRLDWLTELAIHHGSLDRRLRGRIEEALKEGRLRAVVCTSSLDLGVDFAPVDQVIQIGSPKGIARLAQRAGRSGHQPGATSRVLCVPTFAWELVEIAAAREASAAGRIEARRPLRRCLDVLVQHAVTLATGPGFEEDALLEEVRGTHAFAELTAREWRWVMDFVTRGGAALQGYPQYRRVVRDGGVMRIGDAQLARRHRMSIGTITGDTEMLVKFMNGRTLGTLEESFIGRLRPRDTFLFSGRALELVQVRDMTAYVRAAKSRKGPVAIWQGGRMPLSTELADAVMRVMRDPQALERHPEMRAAAPLLALQSRWSALPAPGVLLVERMASREGQHLYVYPFAGRLANEGLATLFAARWTGASPRTVSVSVNDYGFEVLAATGDALEPDEIRALMSPEHLARDLLSSVNVSELARRQFRDIARIAGLVFQGFPGSGKSTRQLQASSGLIFDVLAQYDADNLLLEQARVEVLEAQLELARLRGALERMAGAELLVRDIRRLTPLAFPLWAGRLQSQLISSENWQSRIERAAAELEAAAAREGADAPSGAAERSA